MDVVVLALPPVSIIVYVPMQCASDAPYFIIICYYDVLVLYELGPSAV